MVCYHLLKIFVNYQIEYFGIWPQHHEAQCHCSIRQGFPKVCDKQYEGRSESFETEFITSKNITVETLYLVEGKQNYS